MFSGLEALKRPNSYIVSSTVDRGRKKYSCRPTWTTWTGPQDVAPAGCSFSERYSHSRISFVACTMLHGGNCGNRFRGQNLHPDWFDLGKEKKYIVIIDTLGLCFCWRAWAKESSMRSQTSVNWCTKRCPCHYAAVINLKHMTQSITRDSTSSVAPSTAGLYSAKL